MSSDGPTALVAVANGSEEIEFVSTVDTLARGGVKVTTASVEGGRQVECSRGVCIMADATIDEVHGKTFDLIALPGGMPGAVRRVMWGWGAAEGSQILAAPPAPWPRRSTCATTVHSPLCSRSSKGVRCEPSFPRHAVSTSPESRAAGRWIGAICAAPSVVLLVRTPRRRLLPAGPCPSHCPLFPGRCGPCLIPAPRPPPRRARHLPHRLPGHDAQPVQGPGGHHRPRRHLPRAWHCDRVRARARRPPAGQRQGGQGGQAHAARTRLCHPRGPPVGGQIQVPSAAGHLTRGWRICYFRGPQNRHGL